MHQGVGLCIDVEGAGVEFTDMQRHEKLGCGWGGMNSLLASAVDLSSMGYLSQLLLTTGLWPPGAHDRQSYAGGKSCLCKRTSIQHVQRNLPLVQTTT
jgi:hypothetical protein